MQRIEYKEEENTREKYYNPDRGPDERRNGKLEGRTWKVSELWEKHHEIIRLLLIGLSNVAIADRMGMTTTQISNIKNSPIVQERLSLLKAERDCKAIDLSKDIMELAPQSLDLLGKVIRGEDLGDGTKATTGLRVKVAESNLDRAGYGAIRRVQTQNEHLFYTKEDIEELKQRALVEGQVVDAEIETD